MSSAPEIPPELSRGIPGVVGAIVALRWIDGTPLQRVLSVLGGSAASYYVSPALAAWAEVDHGLAGFLVGLFGMAIVARLFEALAVLDVRGIVERILTRLGL